MTQQNLTTLKGILRPSRRNNGAPPDWHKEFTCGWNPKYPTYCSVYLRRATLEYPTRAIFVQFNNAAGSCYVKLDSPGAVRNLADTLGALAGEATEAWEALAHTETEAQTGIAAFCAAAGIQYNPGDPQIVRTIREMRKGIECLQSETTGTTTVEPSEPKDPAPSTSKSPTTPTAIEPEYSPTADTTETPAASPQGNSTRRRGKGGTC